MAEYKVISTAKLTLEKTLNDSFDDGYSLEQMNNMIAVLKKG